MRTPILGSETLLAMQSLKKLPADYLQLLGYTAARRGVLRRMGFAVGGGSCSSIELAAFNAHIVAGKLEPHELLATGVASSMPVGAVPGGFTAGEEGAATKPIGGYQWDEEVFGPESPASETEGAERGGPFIGRIEPEPIFNTPHINPITVELEWHARNAALHETSGKIRISFTRVTEAPGAAGSFLFLPLFLPRPYPGKAESFTEDVSGTGNAVKTDIEVADPIPTDTVELGVVQISGPLMGSFLEHIVGTPAPEFLQGILKRVAGKRPHATLAQGYFLGLIPRGGELVIPMTITGGGAKDRHKAATNFADDPAVVGAGEGFAGEDAPMGWGTGRNPVDSLL